MRPVFFIRLPELRRMLGGVSTMTINRWEAAGRLPTRVHLGKNTVAWPAHEIEAFVERLMAERRNGAKDGQGDKARGGERP